MHPTLNYREIAEANARAAFTPKRTLVTHFIPFDTPKLARGLARALCGEVVHEATQHAVEPSCPECQQQQANIDGMSF